MERYLVTVQYYMDAKNDKEAKEIIQAYCDSENYSSDSQFHAIDLETAPFGKIGQNRKIKL